MRGRARGGGRAAALLLTALAATAAAADVVELSDGSRLVGTVERLDDGSILLKTDFAGELRISAEKIVRIEIDEPVHVEVDTGDRLVGPVHWSRDIDKPVVRTQLGDIPVELPRIRAIWPPGGKSPEVRALEAQVAERERQLRAQLADWSVKLEIGLNAQEGNTKVFEARGRIELTRKTADDLLKFYVRGDFGKENRRRNTSEVIAGASYEYQFTRHWFVYGSSEAEYDEFESLNLRFTLALGGGRYWIRRDDQMLKTFVGLGYQHESFFNMITTDAATAELGLEYTVELASWLRFEHQTLYRPTFESLDDYRIVSDSALVVPLANSEVWKLRLGAQYQYDPIPQAGREKLDQTYYADLLLELD